MMVVPSTHNLEDEEAVLLIDQGMESDNSPGKAVDMYGRFDDSCIQAI